MRLSPHTAKVQLTLHVALSPAVSHCSPAVRLTIPSPQRAIEQSLLQLPLSSPSSQASPAEAFTILSPQDANVQFKLVAIISQA
jgi:hypothetical protein